MEIHSTGPKTSEGKRVCSLKRRFHSSTNAYRHGLTGQIRILTPDEQQAFDTHNKIVLEAMAPANDFERLLAQSISDDLKSGADDTGSPQLDDAFAQARTWSQEAHNLQLLTIYEQRIQRKVDKNTAQLKAIQAERKEQAKDDMRQAKLLYQLAEAEGKPYQPEAFFVAAPEIRESVFSTTEIAREEVAQALACESNPAILRARRAQRAPVEALAS